MSTDTPPAPPRWVDYIDLDEIAEAEANPNHHDEPTIEGSIVELGFIEPIVLDERTARLVAGHGRLGRLRHLRDTGAEPPEGIMLEEGRWRAPVNRGWASKDDADARAALIVLNEATRNGSWDRPQLVGMLAELRDSKPSAFAVTGISEDRLKAMLSELRQVKAREADPDAVPQAPAKATTKEGDLWKLGAHFLLCGDSFEPGDVDRLIAAFEVGPEVDAVLTDPPYAVYGSSTGIASDIADDMMVRPFFAALFDMLMPRVRDFAQVYVHCDWRSYPAVWLGATRAKFHPKNCIVWDKGGSGLGSNWAKPHEFVAYFAKLPPQPAMTGGQKRGQRTVNKSNVMRHNRPAGEAREHNAAKPVTLLAEIIEAATDPGGLVLDLFAGSGSTLIAAETTGRRCATMESKPEWCDVVRSRFERVTGVAPELVTS